MDWTAGADPDRRWGSLLDPRRRSPHHPGPLLPASPPSAGRRGRTARRGRGAVKPEMTSSVGAALCGRPGGRQAACRNRAATQGAYGILRTAPTEKPVNNRLLRLLPRLGRQHGAVAQLFGGGGEGGVGEDLVDA